MALAWGASIRVVRIHHQRPILLRRIGILHNPKLRMWVRFSLKYLVLNRLMAGQRSQWAPFRLYLSINWKCAREAKWRCFESRWTVTSRRFESYHFRQIKNIFWARMYQGGEKHLQCFCEGFDSARVHQNTVAKFRVTSLVRFQYSPPIKSFYLYGESGCWEPLSEQYYLSIFTTKENTMLILSVIGSVLLGLLAGGLLFVILFNALRIKNYESWQSIILAVVVLVSCVVGSIWIFV